MIVAERVDPYATFNFVVEIDNLEVGGFSEVSGLQVEIQTHDYREGGVNDFVHKLPGPAHYPSNLVLKRGLIDAQTLWQWQRDVIQGRIERKNGAIVLLDNQREERWRWNFVNAYPVKWTGPTLNASGNNVAIETLELTHGGITTP